MVVNEVVDNDLPPSIEVDNNFPDPSPDTVRAKLLAEASSAAEAADPVDVGAPSVVVDQEAGSGKNTTAPAPAGAGAIVITEELRARAIGLADVFFRVYKAFAAPAQSWNREEFESLSLAGGELLLDVCPDQIPSSKTIDVMFRLVAVHAAHADEPRYPAPETESKNPVVRYGKRLFNAFIGRDK